MEHSQYKVEAVYDSLAEEWAEHFAGEHDKKPKDREMLRRFAHEIGNRGPVWDLGCGPGNTAEYLHRLGLDISGLDLSARMLEQARLRHPAIGFKQGDILHLPFKDDSIGGAVAFYATVHLTKDEVSRAFCEVFRVLQSRGVFLSTYHLGDQTIHLDEFLGKKVDIDFIFIPADFIVRSLENSGFERIEIAEREPYPGIEHQSRRAYIFARKPGGYDEP
jgi:ubiquinone/menaquinone biosynthesis C-methylase UbiE